MTPGLKIAYPRGLTGAALWGPPLGAAGGETPGPYAFGPLQRIHREGLLPFAAVCSSKFLFERGAGVGGLTTVTRVLSAVRLCDCALRPRRKASYSMTSSLTALFTSSAKMVSRVSA